MERRYQHPALLVQFEIALQIIDMDGVVWTPSQVAAFRPDDLERFHVLLLHGQHR